FPLVWMTNALPVPPAPAILSRLDCATLASLAENTPMTNVLTAGFPAAAPCAMLATLPMFVSHSVGRPSVAGTATAGGPAGAGARGGEGRVGGLWAGGPLGGDRTGDGRRGSGERRDGRRRRGVVARRAAVGVDAVRARLRLTRPGVEAVAVRAARLADAGA